MSLPPNTRTVPPLTIPGPVVIHIRPLPVPPAPGAKTITVNEAGKRGAYVPPLDPPPPPSKKS